MAIIKKGHPKKRKPPRAESIMQNTKVCYFSGTEHGLDCHHIYGGSYKHSSDKNGLWVWLCREVHAKVQADISLMRRLQIEGQRKFEETHTRAEFTEIFGRNYIDWMEEHY